MLHKVVSIEDLDGVLVSEDGKTCFPNPVANQTEICFQSLRGWKFNIKLAIGCFLVEVLRDTLSSDSFPTSGVHLNPLACGPFTPISASIFILPFSLFSPCPILFLQGHQSLGSGQP
jgi:hypothetical protein